MGTLCLYPGCVGGVVHRPHPFLSRDGRVGVALAHRVCPTCDGAGWVDAETGRPHVVPAGGTPDDGEQAGG
jgi:hypothetical protein